MVGVMATTSMPNRGIGWAIRQVRQAQDRKLEDLAAAIDWDAGNLSRVERDEQEIPQVRLRAIAKELGASMSELWLIVERDDEELAHAIAIAGQLDRDNVRELRRFADYLLNRQAQPV